IENLDFGEVITYLNSGNAIFKSNIEDKDVIANNIHLMIKNKFNLDIPIFIITMQELEEILEHSQEWWGKNDKEIYNNIIYIKSTTTSKEVLEKIGSRNKYEKIQEDKNNVFWSFDLKNYRRSNWWSKTAST